MYTGLPGEDLIESDLEDLSRGVESVPALLVSIGAPRLRRLGYHIPKPIPSAEHRLYERLHRSDPDAAHSRYNALVRRLVSFERAAECAKIEPHLYRYPALDPASFRRAVEEVFGAR